MFLSKQFKIEQGRTTMKVNTDGVLLACWSSKFSKSYHTILDIGSGTGVISLICAQHFLDAKIESIDIEEEAVKTSNHNFKESQWSERLKCYHKPLQDFNPTHTYDLIISNPPFFEKRYKSENPQKNIARHTDSLAFDDILLFQSKYLSKTGNLSIILPVYESELFISKALNMGLYLEMKTEVASSELKKPHRYLMLFSKDKKKTVTNRVNIYKEINQYTEQYKELTCSFYLAF